MEYQILINVKTLESIGIKRNQDGAGIPLDPANTDYAEFKKAVMEGAELQDASGNVMSSQDAQAFIATLP